MTIAKISAVTINCPEWFVREDFQNWLNQPMTSRNGGLRATWHEIANKPSEYSDTFIMHDHFDGSDYDEFFPEDIQTEIRTRCERIGFEQGIIRLTNLAE